MIELCYMDVIYLLPLVVVRWWKLSWLASRGSRQGPTSKYPPFKSRIWGLPPLECFDFSLTATYRSRVAAGPCRPGRNWALHTTGASPFLHCKKKPGRAKSPSRNWGPATLGALARRKARLPFFIKKSQPCKSPGRNWGRAHDAAPLRKNDHKR